MINRMALGESYIITRGDLVLNDQCFANQFGGTCNDSSAWTVQP
jgi:hypothetical protein